MKQQTTPTGSQLPSKWTRRRSTTKTTAALLETLDAHFLDIAHLVKEGAN